jgi:hypothetical protein
VIPGEIITQSGAHPSVLRVFDVLDEQDKPQSLADFLWFEWCTEIEGIGPISMHLYRNKSQLHCDCYALDEKLEKIAAHQNELVGALEKLGYRPVEISWLGFNQNIPQIIEIMDRLSEEYVNCRI